MAEAKKVEIVEEISAEEKLKQLKAEMAELKAQQKAEKLQKKLERAQRRKELMQNGEMPPSEGTISAQIWAVCAEYRNENGVTPTSTYVKDALPELNTHTVQTQTARFRTWAGDVGQTAPVNDPFRKPSAEEFAELKADEQREYLERFKVEGDMSNADKRNALYAELLNR